MASEAPDRLVVIHNPAAGSGAAGTLAAEVAVRARRAGMDATPLLTVSPADVTATVAGVVDAGSAARIVAVGGDGLVHHVGQALAGTGVPLGIVAVGTGNDVARGLGLPEGRDAVDAAVTAEPVAVAAIRCGERWALSVATAGFSADVNARAEAIRLPLGRHVYTAATFLELPRLSTRPLVLDLDGERLELDASLVAVGSTRYFGGGMDVCPAADPFDDLLDVTVIGRAGRFRFGRLLPTVFDGGHVRHPEVSTHRARVVGLDGMGAVWADGEPFVDPPCELEAVQGALLVAGARSPRS